MVFSKREKVILAAAIAAVCLLVLDFYVLSPLLSGRTAVQADKARLLADMAQAGGLLKRRQLLGPKWRRMLDDGMRRDPAEAESQLLRLLRDWSAAAAVKLSSLRPERSAEKSELPEITVHVAGTGSMAAVSQLLWKIETTQAPVKIRMLQLGSRKDGTDDLSLQLKVSTLYVPPGASSPGRTARGQRPTGGDR